MKKLILAVLLLFIGVNSWSQDSLLVNKNGKIILPRSGEFGIGLSAEPILSYIGNMFNNSTSNKFTLNDQTIYFRYFLNNVRALRFLISVNSYDNINNYYVIDDAARLANPLSLQQVQDRETNIYHFYQGRVGYEKFLGSGRLKGFYGADLGFSYQKNVVKREYGNMMATLNPSPTTAWGNLSDRFLENNNGSIKTISLGIFTGGEYFFAPKVCVGAELGLLYGQSWGSKSYTKGEKMVVAQHVQYDRVLSPGNSRYSIKTSFPYAYGSLYVMLHF